MDTNETVRFIIDDAVNELLVVGMRSQDEALKLLLMQIAFRMRCGTSEAILYLAQDNFTAAEQYQDFEDKREGEDDA